MKPQLCLFLLASGMVHGQVYSPPAGQPAAQPGAPQDTAVRPQQKPPASPLGQEIPMLDPSAETITIGGVPIPLGDNRLLRARFEKYLSQPPESDEATMEYRKTIAEILGTVSPFHKPSPNLYDAFKLLPRAATYPGDANICSTLAEAVYMAMLSKQDVVALKKLNGSIEQEKKDIQAKADWDARYEKPAGVASATPVAGGKGGKQPAPTDNPGAGMQSLKYADTLRRIVEIEALKKVNIARTEAQTITTKAQYQVNMVQWFMQRRFEHVIMAARFYNQVWKDGDTTLRSLESQLLAAEEAHDGHLIGELHGKPGVDYAGFFGAALHVSGRDRALLERTIAPYRGRAGLAVREEPPNLEDVFIQLQEGV